ncbi:MAG: TlpA family protein disulfide reductase [Planctomycetota bacterium]|nr:TlpA family protein disulfide reductase [Planctomycetota bacterium]
MRVDYLAVLVVVMALCSVVRADAPATEPSGLPRYHLALGQELTYISSGKFKYKDGTLRSGSTEIYDVVAQNPDGGWHVIGRISSWETQDNRPAQPQTQLIAFDLHSDGTATMSPGVSPQAQNPGSFPALPAGAAQWKDGWREDGPYGSQTTYKSSPSTRPNLLEFTGVGVDPIDRIYLSSSQMTYEFDAARGLVTSEASQNSQGYGFVGTGSSVTTLTSDTDKPRKWLDQFSRDCDIYLAAQKKFSDAMEKLETADLDSGQVDSQFTSAKDYLTSARPQVASPEIADLLDKQIAGLDSEVKYIKDGAENRHGVVDKPAPPWALSDASGGKHSLEDYRGKVVVLDFWYRGCGWCMRAMPEMKKLSAEFAGRPVAVLGMNTDADPADAKFVAGAFGLDYPILHVEQDLVQQYHVQGFPTVFVIGPDGVVREMIVGYSPKLHDTLAAKITALIPVK